MRTDWKSVEKKLEIHSWLSKLQPCEVRESGNLQSWLALPQGFSALVTSLRSMMSRDCTLSSSGELHLDWEFVRNTNYQASPQAALANKITWWLPGWCMAWVPQLTLLLMLRVTCYLLHYITKGRRLLFIADWKKKPQAIQYFDIGYLQVYIPKNQQTGWTWGLPMGDTILKFPLSQMIWR